MLSNFQFPCVSEEIEVAERTYLNTSHLKMQLFSFLFQLNLEWNRNLCQAVHVSTISRWDDIDNLTIFEGVFPVDRIPRRLDGDCGCYGILASVDFENNSGALLRDFQLACDITAEITDFAPADKTTG